MATTITIYNPQSGRASVTVNESVEEVARAANTALGQGAPFVVLTNSAGAKVSFRVDSIHGIFETDKGLEVTIGRAGFGTAMMQMGPLPAL